ncbi:uncharacterized protein EV422DRAFT_536645 [Fimicolochytrium jonesii]|uniref:uncharacterized protein n=1 Tax=Fimicolochytrium jonesii TaxID=1396493 RepID=UPI0022FDD816|nr:uncharacterized protein EV422DRAFT_536645 [Fimicolochytrium jonesii]KAI8818733.1 hypothetical protein EV422DRAFT_536645 [Fimicolochytrium jonesii]
MSPEVILPTPPATPPTHRKSSTTSLSGVDKTKEAIQSPARKSVTKPAPLHPGLPTEIWNHVFSLLASQPANLYPLLTVSKTWYPQVERQLYRLVTFTSMKQRSSFFAGKLGPQNPEIAMEMQWLSGKLDQLALYPSVVQAAEVSIPGASTGVIKGIDFGFRALAPVSIPSVTPTPTPVSSGTTTPTSSPTLGPQSVPNSVALAADMILNSSSLGASPTPNPTPYGAWPHRSVGPLLVLLSLRCPNLTYLGLSGCQFDEYSFEEAIVRLPNLKHLDLSCSNLKNRGMKAIAKCPNLTTLDLSGVFRFRRHNTSYLKLILIHCTQLTTLTVRQCPDLYEPLREELARLRPTVTIVWSGLDIDAKEALGNVVEEQ